MNRNVKSNTELDTFDLAILRIMQQDNTTPLRQIGEAVNLSAAAVQRRIKRLVEIGVIKSNIAVLNPDMIGYPITLLVEVELLDEQIVLRDEAKRAFSEPEEVQQCYYVTGEADFILVIIVPDMAAYDRLIHRLFNDNSNVKRFRTFVALQCVKVGLSVPLSWADVSGLSKKIQ